MFTLIWQMGTSQDSSSHSDSWTFVFPSFVALLLNPRGMLESTGALKNKNLAFPTKIPISSSGAGPDVGFFNASHIQPCGPFYHLPELCSKRGLQLREQLIHNISGHFILKVAFT